MGRYVSIWFRHLTTNRFMARFPELKDVPFVLATTSKGRMVVAAASAKAEAAGIRIGMAVADARAVQPTLKVLDDKPALAGKLLAALGEWAIRYSPQVAMDAPDGLILEVSGCAHLWGGEQEYLKDIRDRLRQRGYDVRAGMADTIGAAWAVARFGKANTIIEPGGQIEVLTSLPPAALRLEDTLLQRMDKLGLRTIGSFIHMPRTALRRRFGQQLLVRIDQAAGNQPEALDLIRPVTPYQERLPCLEPIRTRVGIEIALGKLLEGLCARLQKESNGLRSCMFHSYRVDGDIQQIDIGTNRPTRNKDHLFKLFELKLGDIAPGLGIGLFLLEATLVEPLAADTEKLWSGPSPKEETAAIELLDRIAAKIGPGCVRRYLPAEHYWPERSFRPAAFTMEKPETIWRADLPRPIHLLSVPVPIQVMVPLPDYPPIQFLYQGEWHKISKADGAERIEQEWWLEDGLHRDYYCLEDTEGRRYWVFRLGHFDNDEHQWLLHGFFA